MSGVTQWEHEASSVIDHIYNIKIKSDNLGKNVLGLFISKNINKRTDWQFYILNKNSWIEDGAVIPVIPLTIEQYNSILKIIYERELSINDFIEILKNIHNLAINTDNYVEWKVQREKYINNWIFQYN